MVAARRSARPPAPTTASTAAWAAPRTVPRQPTCASPSTPASGSQIVTGRQSAVKIASGAEGSVVTTKAFGLGDSISNDNNVADSQTMTWGRRRMIAARLFGVVLAGVLMTGASPVAAQPTTGKPQAGSTTRAVELVVQSGHTAEIRALEYARNGRFFATAGKDSMIRIWSPGGAMIWTSVTRTWLDALVCYRYLSS